MVDAIAYGKRRESFHLVSILVGFEIPKELEIELRLAI